MSKHVNDDNLLDSLDLDAEEFTLESILAEYKGSAFIEGDKKTPSDILDERTRRIVLEAAEGGLAETELYSAEELSSLTDDGDFFADIRELTDEVDAENQPGAENEDAEPVLFVPPEHREKAQLYSLEIHDNEKPVPVVSDIQEDMQETAEADEPETPADAEPEVGPAAADESECETEEPECEPESETEPVSEPEPEPAVDNSEEILREAGVTDEDILFFDSFKYASGDAVYEYREPEAEPAGTLPPAETIDTDDFVQQVASAIESQTYIEETQQQDRAKLNAILRLFRKNRFLEDEYVQPDAPEPEEPDYVQAARQFGARSARLRLRTIGAFAVSVLIALFTLLYEKNGTVPFGIGDDLKLLTAILLLAQLAVMLMGVEILVRGALSFKKGGPGAEALIVFSCLVTYAAAFYYIARKDVSAGLPFCAVSSFSVAFAIWAERLHLKAMCDALRTATATMHPYGIMSDYNDGIDRTIVKKFPETAKGFYNNLVQADSAELLFRYFAPILMLGSLLLAVIASIGNERGQYFMHFFSGMAAAAAAFSSVLAFTFPFYHITRRARKLGAAIAGWGGADALYFSDGVRVTDDDLFPEGTVSLSGLKIFDEVRPEKAIRYTASLIIASGSGLTRVFSELLNNQGLTMVRVDDFECYEGGVGALIRGERVLVGSAAFMNLMGIRVPQSLNMKNAVFSAVNDSLIAVFAMNYVPVATVQNALVSMLAAKIKIYFAVRDFNITPLMLQQKFKVNVKDVECMPVHDTYEVSNLGGKAPGRAEAVLCREGFGPFAEAVISAKRLRVLSSAAAVVSVAGAVIGMALMFFMCFGEGFASASPISLLLYMLAMLAADLIIGYIAVLRK